MTERTRKLYDRIEQVHDWLDGQMCGTEGTGLVQRGHCLMCGMRRVWEYDPQAGIRAHFSFSNHHGEHIAPLGALRCSLEEVT